MRAETERLVALCLEGYEAHFNVFCEVYDHRAIKRAEREGGHRAIEFYAVDTPEWEGYHAAVEELRSWCARDRAAAIAEYHELARLQVELDMRTEASLRMLRSAEDRDEVRQDRNVKRAHTFHGRDHVACGLGWPHRGEAVVLKGARYYASDPGSDVARERRYSGAGIYHASYSTENTSHTVGWDTCLTTELHVYWRPTRDNHWGPAMPKGSIPMRLASAPDAPLIYPIPRWPDAAWLDFMGIEYDHDVAIAPGEQLLFDIA